MKRGGDGDWKKGREAHPTRVSVGRRNLGRPAISEEKVKSENKGELRKKGGVHPAFLGGGE